MLLLHRKKYKTVSLSMLTTKSNETRAPIANLPNNAQLGGTPTIPPKLHLHGSVQLCENATRDREIRRHTDGRDQYTFRLGYASREM